MKVPSLRVEKGFRGEVNSLDKLAFGQLRKDAALF